MLKSQEMVLLKIHNHFISDNEQILGTFAT